MKKLILPILLALFACGLTAFAQNTERYGSGNLDRYANELKRQTVDLVDRTSNRVTGGYAASRAEMDEAFLAAQVDAGTGLFQQLIRSNKSASELRDAASILNDSARRAPNYGSNGNNWRSVQNSINDINRELGGGGYPGGNGGGGYPGGGYPGGGNGNGGDVIGRAYWRGTVDDRVQLTVQNQNLRLQTLGGTEYTDGNFSFTSPLPNRKVFVDVTKKKGRGTVTVVQQPSRSNDFTAVIEISDSGSGAKEYQIEIFWR